MDHKTLMGDQDNIRVNLFAIESFCPNVRDIFERFEFHTQIERLSKADLLYLVTEKSTKVDLHADAVTNANMGTVFE
jgi:type I restriction enzyme M protein